MKKETISLLVGEVVSVFCRMRTNEVTNEGKEEAKVWGGVFPSLALICCLGSCSPLEYLASGQAWTTS